MYDAEPATRVTSRLGRVPLRWVDLDAQGHVNNGIIADYLQEARVRFLLAGDNAALLGTSTLVVAHQVEYLAPVEFGTIRSRCLSWVGGRFPVPDGLLGAYRTGSSPPGRTRCCASSTSRPAARGA